MSWKKLSHVEGSDPTINYWHPPACSWFTAS